MTRLRYALALIAVVSVLLTSAALYKSATCSCASGGLPYGAIALWSGVSAGVALGAYVAVGVARRPE